MQALIWDRKMHNDNDNTYDKRTSNINNKN